MKFSAKIEDNRNGKNIYCLEYKSVLYTYHLINTITGVYIGSLSSDVR